MKLAGSGELKHRQLQLPFEGFLQKVPAEQGEDARACVPSRMNETDITDTKQVARLLEEIVEPENLRRAAAQVIRNKGVGGIDGMQVSELKEYLAENQDNLAQAILDGKYRPKPVRRVEIPKEPGKVRKLGIPTVVDRMIQQAICQVLTPIYEEEFSENSYGFRPGRGAHDALKKSIEYANEGYVYVVDMDLEKYFDTVNQDKLVQVLSKCIKDGRVISLIHKFLRAGVMVDGIPEASPEGVPQGGPLSPLLGNVMLHECDLELTRRGHRFVRYADDMMILCRSEKAAKRTLENTTSFIEGKLFLKVNKEKTQVAHLRDVRFLGYGFYHREGKHRLRVHPKSAERLKDKLREATQRSDGKSIADRKALINSIARGWVNYFKLADTKSFLKKIDGWLRRRIRMITWKRWKKPRTRLANLIKLRVSRQQAWEWANTRKKYWRIAQSPILTTTLTNAWFKQLGYISLLDYYLARQV